MLRNPPTPWPLYRGQWIWLTAALAVVIAGKVWVITTFGGLLLGPDTRYIETAEAMLESGVWFWDAGLQDEAIPHSLWKTVGYSGLIALFKLAFGDAWHWWLYGLKAALSLVAGLFLYRLARNFGLGFALALLVFLLHQGSLPVSTDAFLSPNSLEGSLATIVLADVGVRFLEGRPFRPAVYVVYACALALCYLMRMTYEYWVLLFVLALVVAAIGSGTGWRSFAASLLVFCLVFFGTTGLYKAWNYGRTGAFISSTGGQTAYVLSIVRTARFIAPDEPGSIITGDGILDRVVREALQ